MSDAAADDPFDHIDPKDGYRIVKVRVGHSTILACQSYIGGKVAAAFPGDPENVVIKRYAGPLDVLAMAKVIRLNTVLEAVARYMMTGGDWDELTLSVRELRKLITGAVNFPGYQLYDTYVNTPDGIYEHVYQSEVDPASLVVWTEPVQTDGGGIRGGFVVRITQEQLDRLHKTDEDDGKGCGF